MAAIPQVPVYGVDGAASGATIVLPAVFRAPIRPDVVQDVHTRMNKNKRQPYAVSETAGHQTSAESWGTGRAVARIPRVSGGGTHRAGQAAFGNMVRKGRMFAPTKTWRRWHIKISKGQRRYATVSAIAASAVPSLVQARGHRISKVEHVPLVLDAAVETGVKTTKEAVKLLKAVNAFEDVEKAAASKKLRAGKGKLRNRRWRMRRGPLIVYDKDEGIVKAFRNIPGVELCPVSALNLLQLAPGGHIGRFVVWTEPAFAQLDKIFGTTSEKSEVKSGFTLPHGPMTMPDLDRIINSDEVQSVLNPAKEKHTKRPFTQRKNPLRNVGVLARLNPYAIVLRRKEMLRAEKGGKPGAKSAKKRNDKFVEVLQQP
ncbi:ribosomal protein L4 domain-containing protein [Hyaloraphidium curvatum]|nr:ribosomal protein L4 domain-containing protein [Hyaloraphidium curvatum]